AARRWREALALALLDGGGPLESRTRRAPGHIVGGGALFGQDPEHLAEAEPVSDEDIGRCELFAEQPGARRDSGARDLEHLVERSPRHRARRHLPLEELLAVRGLDDRAGEEA